MNPLAPPVHVNLVFCVLLCTVGMFLHFLKKMSDLEAAGTILSPLTHLKTAPYRAALVVMSTYLLLLTTYYMGWLNPLASIFIGVGCSEAYESLRTRAVKKLKEMGEEP